jgi:diguanylate cyclase (GGDEF)-like protein
LPEVLDGREYEVWRSRGFSRAMLIVNLGLYAAMVSSAFQLGGDEFAILLEHVDSRADVDVVLGKIQENMSTPFSVDGYEIQLRASVGVALHPDEGATPDALWHAADQAMYAAKRRRKASA